MPFKPSTPQKFLSDPDASGSRSYYAAFYAVSALFAVMGKTFTRHSTLESAVHRELIKEGIWPKERGEDFSSLRGLRIMGDYGGAFHVSKEDAEKAVREARRICETVHETNPAEFPI